MFTRRITSPATSNYRCAPSVTRSKRWESTEYLRLGVLDRLENPREVPEVVLEGPSADDFKQPEQREGYGGQIARTQTRYQRALIAQGAHPKAIQAPVTRRPR